MWGRIFVVMTLLACAGCNTTSQELSAEQRESERSKLATHLPDDYRAILKREFVMMTQVYGLTGIREAQISNAQAQFGNLLGGGTVAAVCVRFRFRGRNADKYAAEPAVNWFAFTHRQLTTDLRARKEVALISCNSDRVYSPFPEIEFERPLPATPS
ncbi:hypothetical protein [Bradyrhizobium stylosanthis]|uniref:hypothetical protein n=1 Tax=Bradyrhizobium stylosanthis TaxID=1803665 RepID=UPI0007C45BFF|nr:hypothetical protein [Bradyrhizobium stylosanthis]